MFCLCLGVAVCEPVLCFVSKFCVCEQVLQFVHGIVAPLADVPAAELALHIYLQAAYSASEVAHLEMIAYEFLEQVSSC